MKKKVVVLLIILITLLVMIIGGYIIYEKYIKKDEVNTTTVEAKDNSYIELTKSYNIKRGGNYTFTGSIDDGSITIDTNEEVSITLIGVSIINSNGPAINIKNSKKTTIIINKDNTLTSTTTEELDSCIYSNSDLEISGNGTLIIKSNYDGIHSKENIVLKNGTFDINSIDTSIKADKTVTIDDGTYNLVTKGDGVHADGKLVINNGTFDIDAEEGLEATNIVINNGTIKINATDDGINTSNKSDDYDIVLKINGGNITVIMKEGDTDCIDSNGNIIVTGGTINLTGNSTWNYDGEATYTGGTIIENGVTTNSVENSMMMGNSPEER